MLSLCFFLTSLIIRNNALCTLPILHFWNIKRVQVYFCYPEVASPPLSVICLNQATFKKQKTTSSTTHHMVSRLLRNAKSHKEFRVGNRTTWDLPGNGATNSERAPRPPPSSSSQPVALRFSLINNNETGTWMCTEDDELLREWKPSTTVRSFVRSSTGRPWRSRVAGRF